MSLRDHSFEKGSTDRDHSQGKESEVGRVGGRDTRGSVSNQHRFVCVK